MRPVNRGKNSKPFKSNKDSRKKLAEVLGWYCSYCEMGVRNMIELEHVVPHSKGGAKRGWNNFLLACRYCNSIKSNRNKSRNDYLFPDIDNTDLAFEYSENKLIEVEKNLAHPIKKYARNTINLLGLDRFPGGKKEPTQSDTRWVFRYETWSMAKLSLQNWKLKPCPELAVQIGLTAKGTGFYSIWLKVFNEMDEVLTEIQKNYIGTYNETDTNGKRKKRKHGKI